MLIQRPVLQMLGLLLIFSPMSFSQGIKCSINGVSVPCEDTPSSGGRRDPSRGPSAADLARQRTQQAENERQQATKQAIELKQAGFELSQKGDYQAALVKFQAAQKLLDPYKDMTYNDSVEALLDVRSYIAVAEAHVAEKNGDLDLAIGKLNHLCGTLGACNSADMDYYRGLKEQKNLNNNAKATSNLLHSLAADDDQKRLKANIEKTSKLLHDIISRSSPSADCAGNNSASCQLNDAAGNSAAANSNPILTPDTRRLIPTAVKPPEGPAHTGPGAIPSEEGSKEKTGCWADASGNCIRLPPNLNVPAVGGNAPPAKLPIHPELAKKPEFRALLRQSAELTEQINKIDDRLNEIKTQRDAGTEDRNVLDRERYDLINKESELKSERLIIDNAVEDEKKKYIVGFEEETQPGSSIPKPEVPGER
jgi:hypothetical protein